MYVFMCVTAHIKETTSNLCQKGAHVAIFSWQFQRCGILEHDLIQENAQNISQQWVCFKRLLAENKNMHSAIALVCSTENILQ